MALSRSYRRRKNARAAGIAREVNERWPRSEASSRLRTQPLSRVVETKRRRARSLDRGRRTSKRSVSSSKPSKVRTVEGPSTFSVATGTFKNWNKSKMMALCLATREELGRQMSRKSSR